MDTVSLWKSTKINSQVNYTVLSSQGRVKLACHSDVRTESPLAQCVLSFSLSLSVFFVWLGSPCWNKPVEAVFFLPLVFNAVVGFPIDTIYSYLCPFESSHSSLQVLGQTVLNNACMTVALDSDVYAGLNDYFFLWFQKYKLFLYINYFIFLEGLHCTHLYNVIMV